MRHSISTGIRTVVVCLGLFLCHGIGAVYGQSAGAVLAWGKNDYGQCDVPPPNEDFVAVDGGERHSLALKSDGTMVAWGDNTFGQLDIPSPNAGFVQIAVGGAHNLGLRSDGTIAAWGLNSWGECDVPAPNADFVQVAAAMVVSLGLKSDGSIEGWGDNWHRQLTIPAPNSDFVAVALGRTHSLGLKSDGRVVAWGTNHHGERTVPAPNSGFVAIAAGYWYSLGLRSDGTIAAWGYNDFGQCDVPAPNADFVAVAAAGSHSLGLKSDGSVVAWGPNSHGQTDVPGPDIFYSAIGAGTFHSLGIESDFVPPSFCDGSGISDLAPPTSQNMIGASACSQGMGEYEVAERFIGDGQRLAGVGFWFVTLGGPPVDPRFKIRIYISGPNGCPDGDPIFIADCNSVEIGRGTGTTEDPIEYFCNFSDNGYGYFHKLTGQEYCISVQSTNCPGEGELAFWISGDGDGVSGCARGYDIPAWTPLDQIGIQGDRAMYLCNEAGPSFCSGVSVSDYAPPILMDIVGATECFLGIGPVEVTERFTGDDQMLAGVGFWIVWWDGVLPADPGFAVRIYATSTDGCPAGDPIFVAECDVVDIGSGSGPIWDPIEYFCDFTANGIDHFHKEPGVEYSISIQNTNCPGEGEKAYWISGAGDDVHGCQRSYSNPNWTPVDDGGSPIDLALYLCNEDRPSSSIVDRSVRRGVSVTLGHPVPNPTTGPIRYSITLEREAASRVEVFDLQGRVVSCTLDEVLPAGVHTFSWSPVDNRGRELSTGVYFMRLEANGVKETERITVIE